MLPFLRLLLPLAVLACGASPPPPEEPVEIAPTRLRGQALFTGEARPSATEIGRIDPTCAALQEAASETIEDGLERVFVYLADPPPSAVPGPPPREALTITAKRCQYEPAVVGLRVGQRVVLENGDPTLHQPVTAQPDGNELRLEQPFEGMRSELRFDRPRLMAEVSCASHPWMKAHLGVLDHPWFAVTDAAGGFEIPAPPTGDHTLIAWHPELGERRAAVTVTAGLATEVVLDFAAAP
ncbi:MAG: carboxypeptidase regulatory-like domain-containing protein [Acidobacteriota bacterium]